jgi:hypothetical protein
MQFGGKRNLYDVYGYPKSLTADDRLAKYIRQDITSRIVDMPAEETWTNPPVIEADDGDGAFVKAWTTFTNKHRKLWPLMTQVDKLLYFDEFAACLIGLPGDPRLGISRASLDNILYLTAFGAGNAKIDSTEADVKNPRFGRPLQYSFAYQSTNKVNFQAHWTRVVHFVDAPLQGDVLGVPRLDKIYNLLDDLLKIGGGSAETYWNTANRGMQVDVDKDMDFDETDAKNLTEELDEFQHQIRRYIRTRGVKIENLGSEVADPTGVFTVLMALLAAATGIPQRILMGAEAGQLASEQDRANWAEYMERRRKSMAEPWILLPFIEGLQQMSILPETKKPLKFVWPEAFHQNPLERAQTMAQFARATINLSREAQFGFPIVTLEEARASLGLPTEVPKGQTLPPQYEPPVTEVDKAGGEDDTDETSGRRATDRTGRNGGK